MFWINSALILALYYYEKEHPEMVYKRISSERMEEFIKNNGVGFTASTPEEEETEDSMETGETITSYSSYNQVHFSPETTKGLTGDVNGDGTVDLSDAVLIMQSLANPTKYGLNCII